MAEVNTTPLYREFWNKSHVTLKAASHKILKQITQIVNHTGTLSKTKVLLAAIETTLFSRPQILFRANSKIHPSSHPLSIPLVSAWGLVLSFSSHWSNGEEREVYTLDRKAARSIQYNVKYISIF